MKWNSNPEAAWKKTKALSSERFTIGATSGKAYQEAPKAKTEDLDAPPQHVGFQNIREKSVENLIARREQELAHRQQMEELREAENKELRERIIDQTERMREIQRQMNARIPD